MTLLSSMLNRSSNEKPKGSKSQGNNDCYKESTISCDEKSHPQNRRDVKESIDDCEENSREESSPILKFKETRSAHRATMKGQHNKVQVVRMYKSDRSRTTEESTVSKNSTRSRTTEESTVSDNSTRSRTEEESTVSDYGITTSSNMSSTEEESTVSENNTQGNTTTPNKLDIHHSGCTRPHFTAQRETQIDRSGSKSFETIHSKAVKTANAHKYSKTTGQVNAHSSLLSTRRLIIESIEFFDYTHKFHGGGYPMLNIKVYRVLFI